MNSREMIDLCKRHTLYTWAVQDQVDPWPIARAEGVYFWTPEGKRYLDFNSTLVSGDAREGGDADRMKFCGSGALAAVDKGDYATFMRVAMRSSLSATYTTGSLGFRCARDTAGKQP